ncbi:thioredoxin family protein [Luteimonas sp. JM171]|uniref:thioredoxin family protein n=1 Tax=Luteimonas sp. JM171 TaxID=1896164 RepID=UPI000858E8E1|nr:thioredoxin family protein [Luteimonas sp. JM171]AOH35854.1 thiol reductase thioredoxin [Luteimonas sp. JM171]
MKTLHARSAEEFHAAITGHPQLLVDFHKQDCPGCRMLEMSLRKVADDPAATGLALLKVGLEDVGEDLFRSLGLRQTPTLSLYGDGVELARLPGFQPPARILDAVETHFAGVPA